MIKSIDQLKARLLNYSDTERLERHANLEVAYVQEVETKNMLIKSLKQSQLDNADLRYQIKQLVEASHDGRTYMPLTSEDQLIKVWK